VEDELDLDLWVRAGKRIESRNDHVHPDELGSRHPYGSSRLGARAARDPFERRHRGIDVARDVEERLAARREAHTAAVSHEQRPPEHLLETLDVAAGGGLGRAEGARAAGERP